ncbi:translation initiation factor 1A/IF-1 [Ilyonectria robusta]|uniref:translation initiation factor 1A/IF-1 n=1 Tax=Ilyonectria robusta TaxID=1079257 RepID=UPI001E8E338B|nr:translation initiation factor 1A/IF-1 [Ilyonectria robusta]KAH6995642.1 translation initiation factor 1A/IF-1 [Ilyonectria sp. MPI-CAGE-AT-0026]KAH8736488.1 translation initiation factor 1A/IF-1 [Ilyonectria robusta]
MGRPKRNVLAAAEESMTPPGALEPNQSVVRVVKPEGNNLYTCELPNTKPIVLELAQRFRNTIWIKRGGFVLAERYEDNTHDGRAMGEIVNVVRDEKLWRKQGYWPKEFSKNAYNLSDSEDESNVGKMPPSDSEDDE